MRLFTALRPPDDVVEALRAALDGGGPWHPDGRWRPVPPQRWHVTLAFHGQDEPGPRARALDAALAGHRAPWLRLSGAGTFPGVALARVQERAGDGPPLRALAAAAGADPATFRAHLTLARRSRSDDRDRPALAPGAHLGPGPWWHPAEVVLFRSDPGRHGVVHTPVHRVPLAPPDPG